LNYRIIIIDDACKGVDVDDIASTKKQLINKGAIIINSKQVLAYYNYLAKLYFLFFFFKKAYKMVSGEDRRPELGFATISNNQN
jgi:hypothetical protein